MKTRPLTFPQKPVARNKMTQNTCILEGIISVEAAIKYRSREVFLCYVDAAKVKKRDRHILSFLRLLKETGIKTEICERSVIDAFLGENSENSGSTHGGVAAVCGERKFTPLETAISETAETGGFCVILDGVEDPFNFGYSLRNLYAAGVSSVIVPKRNWLSASGVCARASAGASEMCSIAVMPEMSDESSHADFIRHLKKLGFYTVCAAKTAECESIFEFEPEFPCAVFIGGEKRGISPEFVKRCDSVVCIPYFSDARFSLPTASTAAIFGFELAKRKSN